jgi:hypothetical protein
MSKSQKKQKKIPVIKADDKPFRVEVKSKANTYIKNTSVEELNRKRYTISDEQWNDGWRWREYTDKKGNKGKIVDQGAPDPKVLEPYLKQYGGKVNTYRSPRKSTYED